MASNTSMIMDFVSKFLVDNHCDDILESWEEKRAEIEKILKKATKKTKASSPKDPNRPKRGRSAYIFFCSDKRSEIKESMDEDAKPSDVMKEMGVRWRLLKESSSRTDKAEVKRYEEMAAKDKERFANEMETYVPLSDEEIAALKPAKKGRKKSTTKDKGDAKPKRARSAYIYFGIEMRPILKNENPEADSKEITSLLGELWTKYKEEEEYADEVERFKEMAAQDKERYNAEIEKSPEESTAKATKKSTKSTKSTKQEIKETIEDDETTQEIIEEEEEVEEEEEEEKPKPKAKPKKSAQKNQAYLNYCKAMRQEFKEENPEATTLQITKMMGEAWKEMEESEKLEWENE